MNTRWLAGALLFTLGFGSALLIKLPSADASPTQGGVVEGTLKYIDSDDAFQLIYPPGGGKNYLVVAARDPDTVPAGEPVVTYQGGGALFYKRGLRSLTVLRLEPIIVWKDDTLRCGNFPVLCALPPPPPPPIHHSYMILKSDS